MKKIHSTSSPRAFLTLIVLMAAMSINAQVVKVYVDGKLSDSYFNSPTNNVEVVFEEASDEDANLLPGKFSVGTNKQVQFTRSNLYWDGYAYRFEANQTDVPTFWNAKHVGHFFWTNLTDYQSGNAAYMPYAEDFACSSRSASDKCWCGPDNPLTAEGTEGLYALSGGDKGEWYYLLRTRRDAHRLYKFPVTVTNNGKEYTYCLIIAPDDYQGTLQSSYTLAEVDAAGLVCLPPADYRNSSSIPYYNSTVHYGLYLTATPTPEETYIANPEYYAHELSFTPGALDPFRKFENRYYGLPVRLVKDTEPSVPEPVTDSHEYVDLGLPSGTLWATCNIGAETPSDAGLYFAWGETTGYPGSQAARFTMDNYKWYDSTTDKYTKYTYGSYHYDNDGLSMLEYGDDAAYVNWGSNWCMPTVKQYVELINECSWTYSDALNGCIVTSKTNGNSIFLPAAGYALYGDISGYAVYTWYWTRELAGDGIAEILYKVGHSDPNVLSHERLSGLPIRPVRVQY